MGDVDFIAIGKDAPNLMNLFSEKGGHFRGRGKGAPFYVTSVGIPM